MCLRPRQAGSRTSPGSELTRSGAHVAFSSHTQNATSVTAIRAAGTQREDVQPQRAQSAQRRTRREEDGRHPGGVARSRVGWPFPRTNRRGEERSGADRSEHRAPESDPAPVLSDREHGTRALGRMSLQPDLASLSSLCALRALCGRKPSGRSRPRRRAHPAERACPRDERAPAPPSRRHPHPAIRSSGGPSLAVPSSLFPPLPADVASGGGGRTARAACPRHGSALIPPVRCPPGCGR